MSDSSPSGRSRALLTSEFGQRVLSGVALAAVALGVLWAGAWPFGVLVAVIAAVACWEWGRIVRSAAFDGNFLLHATIVVLATLASTAGYAVPAAIALIVGAIVLIILRIGARDMLTGLGVLAIGVPAVSLAHLRADRQLGFEAVLFLFVVVWMTDIGGYVFGRSIGGPKLWPSVSPGKTWAGAIGGLVLAAVAGALTGGLFADNDVAGAVLVAVMLGLAAEIGDLAESALKRRFGRKDASSLIPGHGGVLDRIDGLLAAAMVATIFAMLRDPMHPASGLLLWP
jgi:phosphatidate cytidylyltransferase